MKNATNLVVVLAAIVVPVQAGMINGTFDGNSTLTPTSTPGIFTQHFSGDGDDTLFGSFTASSTSTIDFSQPPNIVVTDSMLRETFGDGTLIGAGTGSGTGNGQGMATFTFEFLVTEGTGIFKGDKGNVTVTGTIVQTSPTTESVTASYTGSLTTVPEPSTLILLAAGLAALRLYCSRGEKFR
ncbi:MAG TPA: PEP-CTERM sorting domain-containing protein [Bryobacteraceae bacterium]|nr:PEP-CTERM sorting domain-containing protein [Bryobacteraceae bacterium]